MDSLNYTSLNDSHIDVLRELGNIGSGNAATSLAFMLGKEISISIPKISVLDYNQAVNLLGGPESMIVGMFLTFTGDVNGIIMFLMQKDFAHMVLNVLMGQDLTDFSELGEMEYSALTEISNIMSAAYIGAIATLTGFEINISVPAICADMAGAILSVPTVEFANISDKIMFIEDEFTSEKDSIVFDMLMMPDIESLQKIMVTLGIEL